MHLVMHFFFPCWKDPKTRGANVMPVSTSRLCEGDASSVSLPPGPGSPPSLPSGSCSSLTGCWGSVSENLWVVSESGSLSKNMSLSPGVQENRVFLFLWARKTLMKNEPSGKLISKIYAFPVTNKPAPVPLTPFIWFPPPPLLRVLLLPHRHLVGALSS